MAVQKRALRRTAIGNLALIGVGAVIVTGAGILFFVDPATSSVYPPYPFYLFTGLWCPGCGSGRALHALLHGDVLRALDLNPLMIIALPVLGYAGVSRVCVYLRAKPLPRVFTGSFWGWFVVGLVFVYWVARNTDIYPLTVLAP